MTIIAALIVCLAVKVTQTVDPECQNAVNCPCGNSAENITVCVPDISSFDEVCTRLSNCTSCREGPNVCLKCLKELKMAMYFEERSKSRKKRQSSYYTRQTYQRPGTGSYRQNCPNIDSPKLGSIRCFSSMEQQTCTGKCLPGYHFSSGSETEMTLTCQRGVWSPRTSFPDCRSGGHCDLIVTGAGAFNCTTGMDGTRCDVICSGRYAGRYFCYPGRDWEPILPRCVKPKPNDSEGRTACRCKNGGTCDNNGKCICSSDWMGNECEIAVPKKVHCHDPGFVPNGIRRHPDGTEAINRRHFEEGQSVVYTCMSDEYALQGSSILICKPDGTWSKPLPNCIKTAPAPPKLVCTDPGHRSNSNRMNPDGTMVVGVRTDGQPAYPVGHSLVYTCHAGFALEGQSLITCLASGRWSARTPYCRRIPSPTPATERTTKPAPEQKFCIDPRVDVNGIREPKTPPDHRGFPPGSQLVYSCEPGYDLIGATTIFCLIQGSWSSDRPRCVSQKRAPTPKPLAYCQYPGDIVNGRVLHVPALNERRRPSENREEEYPEESLLQYSCVDGYNLEGPSILTCTNTGIWSAAPPTCVPAPTALTYCPYPGDIANGRVVYMPNLNERRRPSDEMEEEYPEDSRLQYSCDDGYTLEGPAILTCRSTGTWSSNPPKCKKAPTALTYCPYPGDIANGRVVYMPNLNERRRPSDEMEEEYPEDSRLQYSCGDGYTLEGPAILTCRSTGTWSSNPPKCKKDVQLEIFCETPDPFSNGKVEYQPVGGLVSTTILDADTLYLEGSRLVYSCSKGYTLVGSPTLICEKSGSWSTKPPICRRNKNRAVFCKHPGNVGNAQVVHIPPAQSRQRPTNQGWEEYPAGSQLQYSCDEGYTLEGPFVLYCQNNGSWTAKPPTCINDVPAEIMYCDNPGMVLNGRVQYYPPAMSQRSGPSPDYDLDEYPEEAILEYSCDEGYFLEGPRSITCQSTGFWSRDIPMCVPDCGRSFMLTHRRVYNGSKTISGDWPWVVSISVDDNDSTPFICGGAVLNSHTVITAAHCLTGPLVSGRTFVLRFGKHHYRIQDDDDEVLVRRSTRVVVHPDYSNRTLNSDIGLIIFKPRIRYSVRVQPLCLPTVSSTIRNIEPGSVGYVAGWGETENEAPPDVMMLASLPVISNRECMDAYRQENLIITSNMFCAGYEDKRQSVCSGDSGSPFVFYDRKTERYTLEGLVSFSRRGQCGVAGKYAIFTKVFRFLTWILKNSK